jgi:hypothetical protein
MLSITNGHYNIKDIRSLDDDDMTPIRKHEQDLDRYLEPLRILPFVRALDVKFKPQGTAKKRGVDAEVSLTTPCRTFTLAAEFRRTYLDRTAVSGLIADHAFFQGPLRQPLLLIARYIPTPAGERLAAAGINFLDAVGNVHLNLGDGDYHVHVLGHKERKPKLTERRTTAAMLQVMFALLVGEKAANWPVRKLAEVVGVGKSAAALARQRLVEAGTLVPTRGGLGIANRKAIEEEFVAGYERVLRPSLVIGTFCPLERDPEALLANLGEWANRNHAKWAATGSAAAFALDRYYRGEPLAIFLAEAPPQLTRELKLLPDANGTATLLHAFGTLFPWRIQDNLPIAHPLLIYAELLHQAEPRALEAAVHIREQYLAQ